MDHKDHGPQISGKEACGFFADERENLKIELKIENSMETLPLLFLAFEQNTLSYHKLAVK